MGNTNLRRFEKIVKAKRINRSPLGNGGVLVFLCIIALFMALPLVYVVCNAFKPLDELFLFPPKFFVYHPTLDSFKDLFALMANSWVPFTRYSFNSIFLTVAGTVGSVLISSLAAFPLAKHKFPFRDLIDKLIVMSLYFTALVTGIVNYITYAKLGWINTYWSAIIPAFLSPFAVFLMRQFMQQVPDSLLESARIDGANEFKTFWVIVMPAVKPAWLTLVIFSVQGLWNGGGGVIFSENLKTLPIALGQVVGGGIARAGAASAVGLFMLIPPLLLFILFQSQILETMATSGMKE